MQDEALENERRSWLHDPNTFYDYRREREFYKYYEPFQASRNQAATPLVDVFDDEAVKNHKPCNRLDSTLTAFCQLGALRLRTRRCMLFFFDTEYAYILAEATQTLSLQDDQVHDQGDSLWLGTTIIPRGLSVCEHTVNIPTSNAGSNRSETTAAGLHIINNLQEDTRFCDRPFVTAGPRARFYAGVPIRTPSGYSIGAFCALDDKPRDGLTVNECEFMRQMAKNVIDHLENVRHAAEYGQGSRMLTSIGTFFKTAPVVGQHRPRSAASNGRLKSLRKNRSASASTVGSRATSATDLHPESNSTLQSMLQKEAVDVNDFAKAEVPNQAAVPAPAQSNVPVVTGVARSSGGVEDDLQDALEDSIASTFDTAADLICAAADADGVVFLDVKNQAVEGRVRRRHKRRPGSANSRRWSSDTDGTSTDASYTTESDDHTSGRSSRRCKVLGQSISKLGQANQPTTTVFPLKVIKFLLRRYRQGKIWNFNSEGMASLHDSASDGAELSDNTLSSDAEKQTDPRLTARQNRSMQEMEYIRQLVPGVRALCFVPLWDPAKERVYAVGLMTTYSPHRVLSNDGELSFLRAFCDVVMANVGRLESSIEEQAKTQFISSISHELRSPLHGILGGIDFLHGQEKPDKTILSQIEKCATTLIEIIEHLLEYAKINNLTKQHTLLPGHSRTGSVEQGGPDQGILLAKLTEDVADATFYSHLCAVQDKPQSVSYIYECNLDSTVRSSISIGAWKRLCMNIINNALKYTVDGYIKVSLSQKRDDNTSAQLVVEDTGIGMSKDFLESGLFRAFHQEDSLNPGTGLGMSLVAKLVRSIGGEIEVRSKKNSGTTVKITVPITEVQTSLDQLDLPLKGTKISFDRPNNEDGTAVKARAARLQVDAVQHTCEQVGAAMAGSNADYHFVLEHDYLNQTTAEQTQLHSFGGTVVVLCNNPKNQIASQDYTVLHMTQPFGAEKISQTLLQKSQINSHDAGLRPGSSGRAGHEQDASNGSVPKTLPSRPAVLQHASSESTATARLPPKIRPTDASIAQTATLSKPPPQPGKIVKSNRHKMPLLLVDDNSINLRILTMYAVQHGHPYMTAANGKEAVEEYIKAFDDSEGGNKVYPQVIFMDINMPIMSGFEATRQIRSYERIEGLTPSTVIALTGLGSSEAQEQAASCGVDLFLTKPVRTKELTHVLETIAAGSVRDLQS